MNAVSRRRVVSLKSWLVRALIPERMIGTYILYRGCRPIYTGRSDHDLRRRLVAHAYERRAEYFDFEVYGNQQRAFEMECALFHALADEPENSIHPASPRGTASCCSVCSAIRERRQLTEKVTNNIDTPHT